ncbi:hypothetical protein [Streptomyces sp. NPDC050759]
MALSDLINPVVADELAKFTGKAGKAAGINEGTVRCEILSR